jgi:hypothetical protein
MARNTVSRAFALQELIREGVVESDAELSALIVSRDLPPPILDSSGRERFHVAELSAFRERRWAMRAKARRG